MLQYASKKELCGVSVDSSLFELSNYTIIGTIVLFFYNMCRKVSPTFGKLKCSYSWLLRNLEMENKCIMSFLSQLDTSLS